MASSSDAGKSRSVSTKGQHGEDAPQRPFVIGVAGGSASGKTTVCSQIMSSLDARVCLVAADSFYKTLDRDNHVKALAGEYNFDHPEAMDLGKIEEVLRDLREGKSVEIPVYDFISHSRMEETVTITGAEVIIFEGILALYDKNIRDLLDLQVFVDTDDDVRLVRRIKRDIRERGLELDFILAQHLSSVKPCFDEYVWPTKKYADIIIPRGGDNAVAIRLLIQHIRSILAGLIEKPHDHEIMLLEKPSAENV